jgi:hypothetical protein
MYQPTDTLSHTVAVISARFFCQCTPRTIQLVSCIVSARRLSRHEPSRRVRSRRRDRWSAPSEKTLTQRQATSEITRPASIHARAQEVRGKGRRRRGIGWLGGEGRRLLRLREMRGGRTSQSGVRVASHMHSARGWRRARAQEQQSLLSHWRPATGRTPVLAWRGART